MAIYFFTVLWLSRKKSYMRLLQVIDIENEMINILDSAVEKNIHMEGDCCLENFEADMVLQLESTR